MNRNEFIRIEMKLNRVKSSGSFRSHLPYSQVNDKNVAESSQLLSAIKGENHERICDQTAQNDGRIDDGKDDKRSGREQGELALDDGRHLRDGVPVTI